MLFYSYPFINIKWIADAWIHLTYIFEMLSESFKFYLIWIYSLHMKKYIYLKFRFQFRDSMIGFCISEYCWYVLKL